MHEPRNAKEQIEKAFLDLLEEKPYMDITVTDIVKKADVARVTYYRNFDSISDIIESITDRMADEFVTELAPMLDYGDDRSLREFLFHFFIIFPVTVRLFLFRIRRTKISSSTACTIRSVPWKKQMICTLRPKSITDLRKWLF